MVELNHYIDYMEEDSNGIITIRVVHINEDGNKNTEIATL